MGEKARGFLPTTSYSRQRGSKVAVLKLEGEAKIWWISHLDHARVSTLAEFSQRMISRFGKNREDPSPPFDEACNSTIETM